MALSHYWLSGVIRNGSQYESEENGKFSGQNGLNGLQMFHFEFPSLSHGSTPSVGGENHHFSLVWEEQEKK